MKDIERKMVLDKTVKHWIYKAKKVKEQTESIEADAIETMVSLAQASPVIEHGAVNAVYYKDLIVLSGKWKDEELTQLRLDYPQIKHIITIHNKSFDRWNKS